MKVLILHDTDPDGMLSAVLVGENCQHSDKIIYCPALRYQDPPLSMMDKDTSVYIVDFCYSREETIEMAKRAKHVTILDHHKTAQNDLKGLMIDNVDAIFDINKAACHIVWSYFTSEKPPFYVDYVEDADLWKWNLPLSKEVNAFFSSIPSDIGSWQSAIEESFNSIKDFGHAICSYKQSSIDKHKELRVLMNIAGHAVPAINCSDVAIVSEACNHLAQGSPFSASFYMLNDGSWKFSLRSSDNGINVREIAEKFGGGGHDRSAGFKVDKLFPVLK